MHSEHSLNSLSDPDHVYIFQFIDNFKVTNVYAKHCMYTVCLCALVILTLGKMGRIIVDVRQFHGYRGGSRKSAKMSTHVFSLEYYEVLILSFSVQIRDCCAQDTFEKVVKKKNERDEIQ